MKLVRMLPDQIEKFWNIIARGVRLSSSPRMGDIYVVLNNVHKALIMETVQCWAAGKDDNIVAFVLTYIRPDDFFGVKELVICSIYSFRGLTPEDLVTGADVLRGFARGQGCWRVVGYTVEEKVVEMAKVVGWNANTRFITSEV